MKTIRALLLALFAVTATACGTSSITGPGHTPDSGSLAPIAGDHTPDSGS